jgi:hypothetical protein
LRNIYNQEQEFNLLPENIPVINPNDFVLLAKNDTYAVNKDDDRQSQEAPLEPI